MRRACKVTLRFLTGSKRRKITALLQRYRSAVNFFIRSIWDRPGGLNKETFDRFTDSTLPARYRSAALKQALDIVIGTRRAARVLGRAAACPDFTGSAILSAQVVNVAVEDPGNLFDVFVRLSTLERFARITLPTKATVVLRKWLSMPGAHIVQGCALREDSLVLWVEIPNPVARPTGDVIAVDLGLCKLVTTSEGEFLGTEFRGVRDKINRRVLGSKGRQRAQRERDNLVGQVLNQLPWHRIRAIGREDLRGITRGRRPNRGRAFRRAVAPWVHRQVAVRLDQKAQDNGVVSVVYEPRGTSQECPACGRCDSLNRQGESFLCRACAHAADADVVGAQNGLVRTLRLLGSVESPRLQNAVT